MENNNNEFKNQNEILNSIKAGFHVLSLEGNFRDYIIENDKIYYKPSFLFRGLSEGGFHVLLFSKSAGLRYLNAESKSIPGAVLNILKKYGLKLNSIPQDNEISGTFRAFQQLLLTGHNQIKFAILLEYSEHISPAYQTAAAASEDAICVTETIHSLATNPGLVKSGNALICTFGTENLHNKLLNELKICNIPFPSESETKTFIEIISRKSQENDSKYAALSDAVSVDEFARLVKGLRLMDVENIFKEAMLKNQNVTRNLILKCKTESISKISENTLEFINTELTFDDIAGMQVPKYWFNTFAEFLKKMSPNSPRGILCLGPAGTGKTTLAAIFAKSAGYNIVKLKEIENMYVGESQRKMRLALQLIESLAPVILYIDEIELIVTERSATRNDGGVKSDLMAQLFEFTSRDDLRGKVVLLASSNLGYKLDFALLDRFSVVLPILELPASELTELIPVVSARLNAGNPALNPEDPDLIETGKILAAKGTSPRRIYDIITHATYKGGPSPKNIKEAAITYQGNAKPMTTAYTALSALSIVTQSDYFPWIMNPDTYTYPWYLEDLVDKTTGALDREMLDKRLSEYEKHITH